MDATERHEIVTIQTAEFNLAKELGVMPHQVSNATLLMEPSVVKLGLPPDRAADLLRRYCQIDVKSLPPLVDPTGFEPMSADPEKIPDWTVIDNATIPPRTVSLREFAISKKSVYLIEFEKKVPLPPADPSRPIVELPPPVMVRQYYGPIEDDKWPEVKENAAQSGTQLNLLATYPVRVYQRGDELLLVAEGDCDCPHRFNLSPPNYYRIPLGEYQKINRSARSPDAPRFPRLSRMHYAAKVKK